MAQASAMLLGRMTHEVCVARQGIHDRSGRATGHELLFRPTAASTESGVRPGVDDDSATATVLTAVLGEFGVGDLAKLTPAQAALLAALPQSPSTFDPYRFATPNDDGKLELPADAAPVVRRNYILANLSSSRWTTAASGALSTAATSRAAGGAAPGTGGPTTVTPAARRAAAKTSAA